MNLGTLEIARIESKRQALHTSDVATESEEIAGGTMCFAGPGSWANQASGLGLSGPVPDADLDRLVRFYVDRGFEPRIEVCALADDTLVNGLASRGFTLRGFENVLARSLDEPIAPVAPVPGLTIQHVDPADAATVRTFIETATSGFRTAPLDDLSFEVSRRTVKHPDCDSYIALIDGVAAGGGSMESRGEGAALFGTSVLPEFRRRGIQAHLIKKRLDRARQRGCRVVCIDSRPGIPTERNAARLGFALAYAKVVLAKPGDGLAGFP